MKFVKEIDKRGHPKFSCVVCHKWTGHTAFVPAEMARICDYLNLRTKRVHERFLSQAIEISPVSWLSNYLDIFLDIAPCQLTEKRFSDFLFAHSYSDVSLSFKLGFLEELIACAFTCTLEHLASYATVPRSTEDVIANPVFSQEFGIDMDPEWPNPCFFRGSEPVLATIAGDALDSGVSFLYHGTTLAMAEQILIRPLRTFPRFDSRRDFGRGYYLTPDLTEAFSYAKRKQGPGNPIPACVLCYLVDESIEAKVLILDLNDDLEWRELVQKCWKTGNPPRRFLRHNGRTIDIRRGPISYGEEQLPDTKKQQSCCATVDGLDFLGTVLDKILIIEPQQAAVQ